MSDFVSLMANGMFEGAKSFWPDLTREQSNKAVTTALDQPSPSRNGRWSVRAMSDAIAAELTRLHGAPRE